MRLVLGAILLLAAVLVVALLMRPVPEPQDRLIDLPVPADRPLRLTVMGTSLTHDEIWPDRLGDVLSDCLAQPVTVSEVAKSGAAVDWALTAVDAVTETDPDVILVEFSINDADVLDGHSLTRSRQMHEALIAGLRAGSPEAAVVLVTMSPAHGIRRMIRPRLGTYYWEYRTLAEAQETGLIDLYPRWLALPRSARGLAEDGLHPDQQVAAEVIAPAASEVLARMAGQACR